MSVEMLLLSLPQLPDVKWLAGAEGLQVLAWSSFWTGAGIQL